MVRSVKVYISMAAALASDLGAVKDERVIGPAVMGGQ